MKNKDIKELLGRRQKLRNMQYKYLWSKMQKDETILIAWKNLRKGKTKRKEVKYIDAHYEEESKKIKNMIAHTLTDNPDDGYNPPKVRRTKYVNEHGKKRIAHLASIREQWYFHIIVVVLEPIVVRRVSKNSCGCIPKRGAHSWKRIIEKTIKGGIRYFLKGDVRKFYDSLKISVVIESLRKDIADERFLYCIEKIYRYVPKGILIGLFISPWLANYVLADLDSAIEIIDGVSYIRYVDDIVILANNKKTLHKVLTITKIELGKVKLRIKSNYQVCKFDYKTGKTRTTKRGRAVDERIGRPLDFMGFVFFSDKTVIRKSIMLSATRGAKRLHRAKLKGRRYYIKSI